MLPTQQILVIAALLCFLTFLTLLSVASEQVRGVREMLLATLLGMASHTLYAFGRELPPLLAYEGANIVYAASSAALLAGYRNLAGMRMHRAQLGAAVAGVGVLIALFHYVIDSFTARTVVVSLFQAGICAEIVRTVMASPQNRQGASYTRHVVLGMGAVVALGHLGRIVWLMCVDQVPGSLLQPTVWSLAFLTAVALALPALAVGGLLMAHRHIVVRAEHVGNHDFLTGAASRKAFFDIAALEIARSRRHAQPLALVLVDMDNFKSINDRWGHQGGDAALQRVVDAARDTLRAIDCVARLGGDEFALLLPNTDLHGATAAATKLQDVVRQAGSDAATAPVLTLSIGITIITAGEDLASAMGRADEALYAAKVAGRDRVVARSALTLVRQRA
jgi:diguanylate cyclase (GGDEF)-like protein